MCNTQKLFVWPFFFVETTRARDGYFDIMAQFVYLGVSNLKQKIFQQDEASPVLLSSLFEVPGRHLSRRLVQARRTSLVVFAFAGYHTSGCQLTGAVTETEFVLATRKLFLQRRFHSWWERRVGAIKERSGLCHCN